jgi:hypothetical protein
MGTPGGEEESRRANGLSLVVLILGPRWGGVLLDLWTGAASSTGDLALRLAGVRELDREDDEAQPRQFSAGDTVPEEELRGASAAGIDRFCTMG